MSDTSNRRGKIGKNKLNKIRALGKKFNIKIDESKINPLSYASATVINKIFKLNTSGDCVAFEVEVSGSALLEPLGVHIHPSYKFGIRGNKLVGINMNLDPFAGDIFFIKGTLRMSNLMLVDRGGNTTTIPITKTNATDSINSMLTKVNNHFRFFNESIENPNYILRRKKVAIMKNKNIYWYKAKVLNDIRELEKITLAESKKQELKQLATTLQKTSYADIAKVIKQIEPQQFKDMKSKVNMIKDVVKKGDYK